jgi:hypothetical protein
LWYGVQRLVTFGTVASEDSTLQFKISCNNSTRRKLCLDFGMHIIYTWSFSFECLNVHPNTEVTATTGANKYPCAMFLQPIVFYGAYFVQSNLSNLSLQPKLSSRPALSYYRKKHIKYKCTEKKKI